MADAYARAACQFTFMARHETNNVEIAACFAPKPLLLVSNGGDWTLNTPDVEFPYVRRIFKLLDAEPNVENAHFADEGHDYGPSKRKAVYSFFAKHLKLNLEAIKNDAGEIDESFVTLLELPDLAVFTDDHPRPAARSEELRGSHRHAGCCRIGCGVSLQPHASAALPLIARCRRLPGRCILF